MLAIAKAFATGPKPKRSVVFVWHTGEEAGLYGSRYNADFPVVPLEKVQAQLNMDMVGRDDCDNLEGDYTQQRLRRRRRSHQHRPAQPDRRDQQRHGHSR